MVEEAKKILEECNNGTLTGAQRKLSKTLNISESKISDCLAGRANPTTHTITIRKKPEWKPKTRKSERTLPLRPDSERAIIESIKRAFYFSI